MKKNLIVSLFCLYLIFCGQAFASYGSSVIPERKLFFVSTPLQLSLNGSGQRFYPNEQGMNVQAFVWTLDAPSGKMASVNSVYDGHWKLLDANEEVPKGSSIVRLDPGENSEQIVVMYEFPKKHGIDDSYLTPEGKDVLNLLDGFNITSETVELLFEDKSEWQDWSVLFKLAEKKFYYVILRAKKGVAISLDRFVQSHVVSESSEKNLFGFVLQNDRGFLEEVLEVDQEEILKDPVYKDDIYEQLREIMLRDDQFVVMIFQEKCSVK